MKRSTLLIIVLITSATGFSQIKPGAVGSPAVPDKQEDSYMKPQTKAGGDIIWQTNFDWGNPADPQGWTLPAGWEIKDLADLGNYWVWMKDSIKGRFTNETTPANFESGADGFIVVPMDAYNYRDNVATENASNTYIMTPPINCTGAPSVVIKLSQYYRFCCENNNTGHLEVLVTNDDGVHWATYDISFGIGHNTFTPVKYRNPEINISDVAAGLPNVRVKIYFHEVPYYFWAIDDLKLCEAYEYDLKLVDSWSNVNAGFDEPVGHVNYLPYSQIGMNSTVSGIIGDFSYTGAFLNTGMADAEGARLHVAALRNGTGMFSGNSALTTIWPLDRDTMDLLEPLHPDDYGDYKVTVSAMADQADDMPADNSAVYYFTVNDTLFQRADMSAESGISTSVWANGNKSGDILAVGYDITTDVEINSVSAYIRTFTASANPTFQFVILKYAAEDDDYVELLTSEIITMDSSKLGLITVPLTKDGESEFLAPGRYFTAWRAWADGDVPGMRLGWDQNARAEFITHNLIYLTSITTWYNSDKLPIIGMNLNQEGGPAQAPVTFNVDMNKHIANGEFHPGSDYLDVAGNFNSWGGSAHMTDPENDGIYTTTVEGLPIGQVIEFKYRINGNWDTSEFPSSGPNRKYTVRYWNILDHIYNNGLTTGVRTDNLTASFNVYPNPTTGKFAVDITNPVASELVIKLVDIQGHVIYSNTIKNVIDYRETIYNQLPKGLYFLTVNNGSKVQIQKVIVR